MGRSVEEVEREIEEATQAGFRGRLLARGQARSLIWRNGELPPGAPGFSPQLSYDLLSYGYGLLGHGLRLLEEGGTSDLARRAFEFSADALESVVTNGADSPDRDFHRFMAAAGYHLGGFSARAYSMLNAEFNDLSLSEMQRNLCMLMLRRLDGLSERLNQWRLEGKGDDKSLADRIGRYLEGEDIEDEPIFIMEESPSISEVLIKSADLVLTDNFLRALSAFILALERGERELLDESTRMLTTGLESAAELNMVPQWWCHRIAVYLINDLWNSSFHARLPSSLDGSASPDWPRLREIFIASLLTRRSRAEIELWPSQLDAARKVTDSSENMVVSLPTSAGKTRIAELCILRCVAEGKRVVFVAPLRALSAQTEAVLRRTFRPLGKTVSTLYGNIGAGSVDRNILKNRDIVVATPEKLDFALRNDPGLLDDVGLAIFDEGHMIGPGEREVRYEVQIQRLLKRDDADKRRIVCLSAVLPEGNELDDFVGWFTNDEPAGLVKENWRPTNIRYGEVIWYGDHARLNITVGDEKPFVPRFIESRKPSAGKRQKPFPADQQELTLAVAWRLAEDGQTVLVFCPQKNSVFSLAEKIVDLHGRGLLDPLLEGGEDSLDAAIVVGEEWFGCDHPLLQCLRLGVAVHHGSLPTPYRREVERLLRSGHLKVTISSPTLAQGLNLSATSLIMFSIYRAGKLIPGSEFKNIEGRAGRAFVDFSGLVLHPVYEAGNSKRVRRWRNLVKDNSGHNVESGLFRLLWILLQRMCRKINPDSCKEMIEYIANNARVWKFSRLPGEDESTAGEEEKSWNKNLSTLDTAVLALLGERDIKDNEIEEALDAIMGSSLFKRTVEREDDEIHALVLGSFIERARYIWKNTTAAQRRGYFLAGVGFETGRLLDAHAEELNRLLGEANAAILNKEKDGAIEAIRGFAEIIFKIPGFKPDVLPQDWSLVLVNWLEGEPMAVFSMNDNDEALHFIEQGIVYRLAWGMDAVRVRGLANDDFIEEAESDSSSFDFDCAVAAVETGTLERPATLLMQSGFGSRGAAIKIARENKLDFQNSSSLRSWLKSEEVNTLSGDSSWPTPQTHDLWMSFVDSFSTAVQYKWKKRNYSLAVRWDESCPVPESVLKIVTEPNGRSTVLNAQNDRLGKLRKKLNPDRKGLVTATTKDNDTEIQIVYYGLRDLFPEKG